MTGQRSNQLNYVPTRQIEDLWDATILRLRPIIEMSWAGTPGRNQFSVAKLS